MSEINSTLDCIDDGTGIEQEVKESDSDISDSFFK
jgi:hypothetical protein